MLGGRRAYFKDPPIASWNRKKMISNGHLGKRVAMEVGLRFIVGLEDD
jgi:hypothetical protein